MLDESTSPKGEYFIDAESASETVRLTMQDRFITEAMGGLFSERSDIATMHSILDLACGSGQWVLDVAYAYPKIEVTGVDHSHAVINYARARAHSQGLNNASFQVMDISKPLDFPDNSFDLVNARLIAFLAPDQWAHLLQECMRITRPGGIVRLTENEALTNSPAMDTLFSLFYRAMKQAGQSFSPTGRTLGIIPMLSHLLQKAGFSNVQHKAHALNFSVGAEAYENLRQVTHSMFVLMEPFVTNVGVSTQEEWQRLIQQMGIEVLSDDFCATMVLLTAWGEKAPEG